MKIIKNTNSYFVRRKIETRILERLTKAETNMQIDFSNGLKELKRSSRLYDRFENIIHPLKSLRINTLLYHIVNQYDKYNK